MDLGLDGKVALVTAASKGIGRAVAHQLAAEGADVLASSRPGPALTAAVTQAGNLRGRLEALPADLTDEAATAELVSSVCAQRGRLDILVVNTPGPRLIPFLEATPTDLLDAFQLLVRPAIQLACAGGQTMAAQRSGSIVFLTSTWVRQPPAGALLSATMRSVISALAKQMALELAPLGVRVNQVMPGATATDRMRSVIAHKVQLHGSDEASELRDAVASIPMGRWAEPEEIARQVAFMASEAASFTTGTAVAVDGGYIRSI
ncbi:MAG TPA: SDR family oxidoreductase [Mycobacterium sp.]|nr:SDR family oxidoreductase [Mycobacterium sp.]